MRPPPLPSVQLITGSWRDLADLCDRVNAALRGGIRWVQLRAKDRSAREIHEAACAIAPLLRGVNGFFVVNDRIDVALAVGADGVHLGEQGMAARDARRLLGDGAWIAQSLHCVDAIRSLPPGAVDAVQFGPVFNTASKRGFGLPQGLLALASAGRAARGGCGAALIAVGGISVDRSPLCLDAGADAVSVIGAIWDADDVETAALSFVE